MNHNVATRHALGYVTPQAKTLYEFARKNDGVSALDAFVTFQITSATLARRMCDLERVGFTVTRKRRKHPQTGRHYTRYFVEPLADEPVQPEQAA